MGSNVTAKPPKLKAVGLVRNSQGQPQFNDWENIPEIFHEHLSAQDWEYIKEQRKD